MDEFGIGMVEEAARRIAGHVHRTPVLRCRTLDRLAGAELHLKAENLQRVGAFKARGGFNALLSMSDEERANGVLGVSSGNHGQAVALAARELGVSATIVIPQPATPVKVDAIHGYGAEIVQDGVTMANRDEITRRVASEQGLTLVLPYDDHRVMAGQGTAGLEICEQCPELDAVVVPIGGGGLISGVATAVADRWPDCRIVGVEPEGADDARRSLEAGERVSQPADTIVDGVRPEIVGERPWAVIRRLVSDIVTVPDCQAFEAMELLWTRAKTVVEAAGALPLAAVLAGKVEGERIGLLLSGGNVDLDEWARRRRAELPDRDLE